MDRRLASRKGRGGRGGSKGTSLCPQDEGGLQGTELGNLNADLLAKVFSYLPQRELFEIMLVNRLWETGVMEDHSLWTKVEVHQSWQLSHRGGGDGRASRLLRAAKEVRFLFDVNHKILMSVMGMLGQELRSLDLPAFSFYSAFFSALPSQLPHLKYLRVLKLRDYEVEDLPHDFAQWPRLEVLVLMGFNIQKEVEVRHANLKSLTVIDHQGFVSLGLSCPMLVELTVEGLLIPPPFL